MMMMMMMGWRRSKFGGGGGVEEAVCAAVPRGCVALLLDGCGGAGVERVVVEVRALGEPRMRALLEKAAREFGFGQKGVLRVPCSADELRQAVAADGGDDDPERRARLRGRTYVRKFHED
ncbi:hypothetical protein GUJ93_ZPchr0004g39895 [Zizania palustris]|uniref:Auxin responsive protein n=1 Tax=Zizania palustris TaxID=103762 RepID=A0A8J5VZW9_ZIZPA|nr:hypothetical protein GUJ93_ZPchr0004g39895 [Zizania palustris]